MDESENLAERDCIAANIQDYFMGMYHRDLEKLRRAFHESAKLFGHLDGTFVVMSLTEWLAKVQARPVPAELGEPFDMSIISVEITGKVASAKVRDLYRTLRFTDYLQLAKVGDRWRIVSKLFHHD